MKKFIKYILATLVIAAVMISVTVAAIVCYPENVFHSSYQSVIQDKFRVLKETNDPKIIIVSGSSSGFGLNEQMLSEATGYKVANLGLHAGFYPLFYTELSKANINPGDIVLLGYEYGWQNKGAFDSIGTELVMSGVDNNIEMYKYVPKKVWTSMLGYIFNFAYKKNTFVPQTGQYSREAFNENGQMTYPRDYIMSDYRNNIKAYGTVSAENTEIGDDVVQYLAEYKDFVEKRGASVYFVAPPLLSESVQCDKEDFISLKNLEEEQIGIPYISNPLDYLYPETLMSNSIYHCNSRGETERTRQLINDLYDANIVEINNIESFARSKDNSIIFIDDLAEYLKEINDLRYTVFITIRDEGTNALTEEIMQGLRNLGIKTELIGKFHNSFFAVITNDGVYEQSGTELLEFSGTLTGGKTSFSVVSAGFDCGDRSSIVINGVEYSRNMTGLNIVVYNNEENYVVDTVNFNTFEGLAPSR